jgi:predicted nucleotidyltransferase
VKQSQTNILERSRPRVSILDYTPEEVKSFLKKKLFGKKIRAAYLFGSFVTHTSRTWSDIDILIIQESELPFIERPRNFEDLLELGIPVDILVYTPNEIKQMEKDQSGFWKEIKKNRIKLI